MKELSNPPQPESTEVKKHKRLASRIKSIFKPSSQDILGFGRIKDLLSVPRVIERLPDGRLVYSSGEIFDKNGEFWGFRLYKGVRSKDWDNQKNVFINSAVGSRDEYNDLLESHIQKIKGEEDFDSQRDSMEAIAIRQTLNYHNDFPAYSWTRKPKTAIEYVRSNHGGIVLQNDTPKEKCVSLELLHKKMKENGEKTQLSEPILNIEREVTVFDYFDADEEGVQVFGVDEFEKRLPSIPFCEKFVNN